MTKSAASKPAVEEPLDDGPFVSCPTDENDCPCGDVLVCRIGAFDHLVENNCVDNCQSPIEPLSILDQDDCDCLFRLCCIEPNSGIW